MPLDPNKFGTQIVIGSDKELMAQAQSQTKYFRNIEDIPAEKYLAVLAIQLTAPLTPEQYYSLFSEAQAKYGAEAIELMFEGRMPDYGEDHQVDFQSTCNLVPRKRSAEEPIDDDGE